MYQINFSLAKDNLDWFTSIEDTLKAQLRKYSGIMAYRVDFSRLNVSVAAEMEFRSDINRVIKDTLVEMYSRFVKMQFLKKHLCLPAMNKMQFKILLHTLVAFDRECESELISSAFTVSSGMALDGIYTFRLKELRQRWLDICRLTEDNALYLSDEATFTELIRFLISAINPKMQKITISDSVENYKLIGELNHEKVDFCIAKDDLLYYLVDLAPMEIVLIGDFYDQSLYNQIVQLFDAKQARHRIGQK